MAAPVKNFSDPTYVSRMLAPCSISPLILPTTGFYGYASQVWTKVKFGMMQLSFYGPAVAAPPPPILPLPPMGRQILLTFPPIYREKGGSTRPAQGSIWPRLAR